MVYLRMGKRRAPQRDSPTSHPLLEKLLAAVEGRFPPVDGEVTFMPPLEGGHEAVVSFTGHAFVASRLDRDGLADLEPDGFGRVLRPEILLRMADGGAVGVIDATLARLGKGGGTLEPNPDLQEHPRVRFALARRQEVMAYGVPEGLFTIAAGIAGRTEMSVEVTRGSPIRGRDLINRALSMIPEHEPVFAAVSPGNARSMRAFLAVGFAPIGSEVLIQPSHSHVD
jgi:hypothetical protein